MNHGGKAGLSVASVSFPGVASSSELLLHEAADVEPVVELVPPALSLLEPPQAAAVTARVESSAAETRARRIAAESKGVRPGPGVRRSSGGSERRGWARPECHLRVPRCRPEANMARIRPQPFAESLDRSIEASARGIHRSS